MLSLEISSFVNYLALFLLFLISYLVFAFFIYYNRRLTVSSAMTAVFLAGIFVFVKLFFDLILTMLQFPLDLVSVIYLVDALILIIVSDYLEVPQRYLRRVSCILLAVITAVFSLNLLYLFISNFSLVI